MTMAVATVTASLTMFSLVFCVLLMARSAAALAAIGGDSIATKKLESHRPPVMGRREALGTAAASFASAAWVPAPSHAADGGSESIDLAALNAARSTKSGLTASLGGAAPPFSVVPVADPPPLLSLRGGGRGGKSALKMPRVGYSLYKTSPDQTARCVSLALLSGVRYLDVATQYRSNGAVATALQRYLDVGLSGLDVSGEKAELLEALDRTARETDVHAITTVSSGGGGLGGSLAPAPVGSAGRRGRREGLFLCHKISNGEQSTDGSSVRRSVKAAIAELGSTYLDMVCIHSPLTDRSRRLATYETLLGLRDAGFARSVGVCNYGLGPLKEIEDAGLDLPSLNQLELSPFNQHGDTVKWCCNNGVGVGCAAWSKLSGVDGPAERWAVVADLAKKWDVTKAQVLVRWAMQKGYVCAPRSGAGSKVERTAIAENSYGGVNLLEGGFVLTEEEMGTLDGLDVGYKAGRLGRRDGWDDGDVSGSDWDPTEFV